MKIFIKILKWTPLFILSILAWQVTLFIGVTLLLLWYFYWLSLDFKDKEDKEIL
jgi:uncharacterized membrane protein